MRILPVTALVLTAASVAAPASAQRFTVLLDPARGGSDSGARIDDNVYEKQVTLDIANRLRALLNARDFNVVLTREADTQVTNETRAAVANTSRPVACLLLHSTAVGTGLHLYTTSLQQAPPTSAAVLWDEAQSPFVQRSQQLGNELTTAFTRARIPVSSGRTWIRPLDNMQCPSVAIEIAPESGRTPASDRGYQNRIASTIAGALLFWRGHADIMQSIVSPPVPPPPEPKPKLPGAKPGDTNAAKPAAADRGIGAPE